MASATISGIMPAKPKKTQSKQKSNVKVRDLVANKDPKGGVKGESIDPKHKDN